MDLFLQTARAVERSMRYELGYDDSKACCRLCQIEYKTIYVYENASPVHFGAADEDL